MINLSSGGQGVNVNLGGAGMRWTATTNNGWITLVSTSGSSSVTSLQFTVSSNTVNYRTGYIYVTYTDAMGYYCNETIEVNQDYSGGGLIVEPTEINADYWGGNYVVKVTSNTSYSVSYGADWVSGDQMKGGIFILVIDENKGYERTATVTVTSGAESKNITITQGSGYVVDYTLDYSPEKITFEASGGTIDVGIRSNSNWRIKEGNDVE